MATRLYLPIEGSTSPPLDSLNARSDWEYSEYMYREQCFTNKLPTGQIITTVYDIFESTTTHQRCVIQYQSDMLSTIYNWTTSDTVSMVIKCYEALSGVDAHLAYCVRVVSNDGSVERGVIGLYHATSTEFTTTASTKIHSARTDGSTNFTSQPGDRIIIEIGCHGVTPSINTPIQLYFGCPSSTADYALTAGLTTTLCPWVELSKDVIFGSPIIYNNVLSIIEV